MPLTQFKVTPEEQAQNGVVAEVGNKLNGTVSQNKAVFDRLCNYLISKYNQVLDLIYTKEETDTQISKKIAAIGAGDMSTSVYDPTGQKKDVFAEIAKKPDTTSVITKTNIVPFTPIAPTHPATKEYVDGVAFGAGAVSSVFGRAGAVLPQDGDYTAAQVNMTGYTKPATWGDILPTDNVAQALGKVDARNLAYYGGSNPNMLINWDFRKPINQRGQMNYTLNGYTIDMWTCNGGELAIVAGGITISQNHVIFQKIERNIDTTKVYTASYLDVNGIVHSAEVSTFGSYITIDANVNVYVDSTTVYFASSNSANIIAAVKLELGTVSTIANDPPANYAEQLALCQRYYVRYAPTAVIWLSKGEAVSTTSARFILYLPQSLRVTPAIGFSNCTVGYEGATAIDITGISVLAHQSNIIAIDCTLASAVTQYRSLNLRLPVGSFIAFDANL